MKMKFWGVTALILFISMQNANCEEHRMILVDTDARTEVANRCTKLQTDRNYFRAYGTGVGRHKNTAKIKAQMSANSELSKTIQAWIKDFLGKYLNEIGENPEVYMRFPEDGNKDIIEEKVFNDVVIACEAADDLNEDALYNVYLILEIKRKKVFDILNAILSADKNWKDVYDRQKMEVLFKAEMGELKKRK